MEKPKEAEVEIVGILIGSDHPIFRYGLRKVLEAEPNFSVVGEVADGEEMVRLAGELKPDVVLIDLASPRCSASELLRRLSELRQPPRSVVLTGSASRSEMIGALQHGAHGILSRGAGPESIIDCVRTVMNGQYWVERESVSDLVHVLRRFLPGSGNGNGRPNLGLTRRELEVVAAIVAGYTNRDIAQKFNLSEQTVKHHVTNIFDKLGVSNRLEVALMAVSHHLVDEA